GGNGVLLHGDAHPGNILDAGDEWRAIDPKGVTGDPCWDVATFIGSIPRRTPGDSLMVRLDRRISQLVEGLALDRRRLLEWCVAQSVLSAWWSFEDHGCGWEPALAFARRLHRML
ncbi:aminoglycoside resistance protein, partial [bacterium]|nr:aminoglycoside resistance protein [candidate division CSSED10-310 bacterium]